MRRPENILDRCQKYAKSLRCQPSCSSCTHMHSLMSLSRLTSFLTSLSARRHSRSAFAMLLDAMNIRPETAETPYKMLTAKGRRETQAPTTMQRCGNTLAKVHVGAVCPYTQCDVHKHQQYRLAHIDVATMCKRTLWQRYQRRYAHARTAQKVLAERARTRDLQPTAAHCPALTRIHIVASQI